MKKHFSFVVDRDLWDHLQAIKARTGLSYAEQLRQALRMWLSSREWPLRQSTEKIRHE